MCTDKTLRNHVDKWNKLKEQEKLIKAELEKESAYIMAELDNRGEVAFSTVKIISRHDERASKSKLVEMFPDVWEKVKTVSDSRFLRKCKEV